MKVFILTQSNFHQGNFGDLEYSGEVIVGVYSTKELAEQAVQSIKIQTFNAQFGSGDSTPTIKEYNVDSNLNPEGIDLRSERDFNDSQYPDDNSDNDYTSPDEQGEDYPDDYEQDYQTAIPSDDSPRYILADSWGKVYDKCHQLEDEGYSFTNKNWRQMMSDYENRTFHSTMFVLWNPTHKQCGVDSDTGYFNENVPHLCNAVEFAE